MIERLTPEQQQRLVELKPAVVEHFDAGNWSDLGLLTGCMHEVQDHPRLLRSLSLQDDDYSTCAINMLIMMARRDAKKVFHHRKLHSKPSRWRRLHLYHRGQEAGLLHTYHFRGS